MIFKNFDKKALEREYSPSSCIKDINTFISQYVDKSKYATIKANQTNSLIANIAYGKSLREKIDLYLPTIGNKKKLHIYIHGGYWQELSKNESSFAATNFQEKGCYFAVIGYTLAPNANLTEIVNQVSKATLWLYQHAEQYGYDKEEIYISGSSAGAHLALMVAMTNRGEMGVTENNSPNIKGLCLVSGIYDLTPIKETYINEPLKLTDAEVANNSPLLMNELTGHNKVIIAFGENETSEFKRQSKELFHKLTNNCSPIFIKNIKDKNHFDVILELAKPNSLLSQAVFAQMNL